MTKKRKKKKKLLLSPVKLGYILFTRLGLGLILHPSKKFATLQSTKTTLWFYKAHKSVKSVHSTLTKPLIVSPYNWNW